MAPLKMHSHGERMQKISYNPILAANSIKRKYLSTFFPRAHALASSFAIPVNTEVNRAIVSTLTAFGPRSAIL